MFADAYAIASEYTRPVIVSIRYWDGTVESACGAFVLLNDRGWIATAAHILDSFFQYRQHSAEIKNYEDAVAQIERNEALRPKQRKKQIGKLRPNPKWVRNHSFWWGKDGVELKDVSGLQKADLAIGRLEPFEATPSARYPVLKDPTKNLRPGTSLCKLGFPFHKIQASFDEPNNRFELPREAFPVPRFPIDGIYSRNILVPKRPEDKYEVKFLETSSAGLRGQSGGPIFDVKATLWGLQVKTAHLALGFNPKVRKNGREVEENQFLNVGWGVHPETLAAFLRDNKVDVPFSDY